MSRTRTSSNKIGAITSAIVALVMIGFASWLWLNKQYVVDQISVWQYQPTAEINSFVDKTTMTSEGRFYLYASHPSVEKTQAFNKLCDRKEATTAVLGCYSGDRIYIYDVTDEQLAGIREVTTAHETLHAIYRRMDDSEKARINTLLEKAYSKLKDDKELAERMAFYQRAQPGEQNNELHSILGTEFADLGPELETYYKQYFRDRQQVVKLHGDYAAVFTALDTKRSGLEAQLKTLGATIESESDGYNKDVTSLNGDIVNFNKRATGGSFGNTAEFNQQRQLLLSRVDRLASDRTAIDADIAKYETLRSEYNEIADASQQLFDSIDSRLAPSPSI